MRQADVARMTALQIQLLPAANGRLATSTKYERVIYATGPRQAATGQEQPFKENAQ